jgi:hypothetical protein
MSKARRPAAEERDERGSVAPDHTEARLREAELRVQERLAEIEEAAADGRLEELVKDTPPVDEQLRPFLDGSKDRS